METKRRESENENPFDAFEARSDFEFDEMTAMNYPDHRPAQNLEPMTAKYLLDFIYFTREDEQFRFYKKVSHSRLTGFASSSP